MVKTVNKPNQTWLEKAKYECYQLFEKDRSAYLKQLRESGKKLENWLKAAERLADHVWSD